MNSIKLVSLNDYIKEILRTAEYEHDIDTGSIVAHVPLLPGCMTQGDNFESTRELLIDAIELWITVGLREHEEMPVVNHTRLAMEFEQPELLPVVEEAAYA